MYTVYTIGHSNLSVLEFQTRLYTHDINFIIDVRSHPYSRFCPQFNKGALEEFVKLVRPIYYAHFPQAGGRPEGDVYTNDGRADYRKFMDTDTPIGKVLNMSVETIGRIITEMPNERFALLCSEGKPHECHRAKWLSRRLIGMGIEVRHIGQSGDILTQEEVEAAMPEKYRWVSPKPIK